MTSVKALVNIVAEKTGLKKKDVRAMYDAFVEAVVETAQASDETKVAIPGIGTLKVSVRQAYTAKNPRTGEAVEVPASKKAYLKVAPKFTKAINE